MERRGWGVEGFAEGEGVTDFAAIAMKLEEVLNPIAEVGAGRLNEGHALRAD